MVAANGPAKQVTLFVVLGILVLFASLFVGLIKLLGFTGVAVFLGLLLVLLLVAAVAGVTLEAAFEVVAYAVGFALNAVGRVAERLGR